MLEFVPETQRLVQIFAQATAPTFFLGAVAAFASLMTSSLSGVIDRMRAINAIPQADENRSYLKADMERLRRRARLLKAGIVSTLWAGLCATSLLVLLFVAAFFELKRAYGAGLLFILASVFLGHALFRFAQQAQISLSEYDEQ